MNGSGDGATTMPEEVFRWLTKAVNDDFVQLGYPSILINKDENEFVSLCSLIKNCSTLITLYKTATKERSTVTKTSQITKEFSENPNKQNNKKWRFLSHMSRKRRKNDHPCSYVCDKIKRDTEKMMEICNMCDDNNTMVTAFDIDSANSGKEAVTFMKYKWKVFRKRVVSNYKELQEKKNKVLNLENQNNTLNSKLSETAFSSCSSLQKSLKKQSSFCSSQATIKQETEFATQGSNLDFGNDNINRSISDKDFYYNKCDSHHATTSNRQSRRSLFNDSLAFSNVNTNNMLPSYAQPLMPRSRSNAFPSNNSLINRTGASNKKAPRLSSVPRIIEYESEIKKLKSEIINLERKFKDERDKLTRQNCRLSARLSSLTGKHSDNHQNSSNISMSIQEKLKSQAVKIEHLNEELTIHKNDKDFHLQLFASVSELIVRFAFEVSELFGIQLCSESNPEGENISAILQKTVDEVMQRLRSSCIRNNIGVLKKKNEQILGLLRLVIRKFGIPEGSLDDSKLFKEHIEIISKELKENKIEKKQFSDGKLKNTRRSASQLSVCSRYDSSYKNNSGQCSHFSRDDFFNKLNKYDANTNASVSSSTRVGSSSRHRRHFGEDSCDTDFDRSEIKSLISDIQHRIHSKHRRPPRCS